MWLWRLEVQADVRESLSYKPLELLHQYPKFLPLEDENGNKFSKTSATEIKFLGAFVKLRKATTSFVASFRPSARPPVHPSVHMEKFGRHKAYFHEILYLSIFRKSVEKIQISSKSNKNNGYFTWRPKYIFDHISLSSSYKEKCFGQICREKLNTHFFSINFLPRKSCLL